MAIVFFDTEFTALHQPHLLSLGLHGHHALVDALALRAAYAAVKGVALASTPDAYGRPRGDAT